MRLAPQIPAGKLLAGLRIAVAVFFLFFGEYKIMDPAFAHGTMAQWLQGFIDHDAVRFYGALLQRLALPNAVAFGYLVGILEMLLGISLLLGIYVRPAAIVGVFYMANLGLATWNELDHVPLLLLFIVFYATNAGNTWGLDGVLKRRRTPPRRIMRAA